MRVIPLTKHEADSAGSFPTLQRGGRGVDRPPAAAKIANGELDRRKQPQRTRTGGADSARAVTKNAPEVEQLSGFRLDRRPRWKYR